MRTFLLFFVTIASTNQFDDTGLEISDHPISAELPRQGVEVNTPDTSTATETSPVVFLAPDPIIHIIGPSENEAEIIRQLEISFRLEFTRNYAVLSVDGEKIELIPDQILIVGVLDAHEHIIYYNSV